MNYLVDTHVLLWYMMGDRRLKAETRDRIEYSTNTIFLSNASLWEIAIKQSIGKLKLRGSLNDLKD